jgi:hypothetical protein
MINNENLNLFDILQNPAIGTIALHSFILGYNNVAKHKEGKCNFPSLTHLFYVLPIVYNPKAINSIKMELYTTLNENKSITLGLQDRANKMAEQTFDSLNLGFSKKIFLLNRENYTVEIEPYYMRNILPFIKQNSTFLSDIRRASTRLGNIFAKKDEKTLQLVLNIRF